MIVKKAFKEVFLAFYPFLECCLTNIIQENLVIKKKSLHLSYKSIYFPNITLGIVQRFRIIIWLILLGFFQNSLDTFAQMGSSSGIKKNSPSLLNVNTAYRIKAIDFSQWCSRGVIRISLYNEGSALVERNHFSFGNTPGYGIQSINLVINNDSSEEVYELALSNSVNLSFPVTLRHNKEGLFGSNASTSATTQFLIPEIQVNDEVPSLAVIGANSVQVLRNLDANRPIASYRWFRDGVLIGSRNSDVFNFTEPGSYSVQLVYNTGCISPISTNLTFITDAQQKRLQELKMFPNPAVSHINIESPNEKLTIEILDLNGRLLHSSESLSFSHHIPLSGYAKGMYLMKISFFQGKDSFIKKFVIQ